MTTKPYQCPDCGGWFTQPHGCPGPRVQVVVPDPRDAEIALLREFFDADDAMLKLRNVPRAQRDHEHLVAVGKAGHRRAEARKAVLAYRKKA